MIVEKLLSVICVIAPSPAIADLAVKQTAQLPLYINILNQKPPVQFKAEALAGAVEGPVSSSNPGSAIQLHPHVTVLVDEAAASQLANGEYYRFAWANKPRWQGI